MRRTGESRGETTMNNSENNPRSPVKRIHDLPSMLDAMRQSVHKAPLLHKPAANAIAVLREEAVAWIPPKEIVIGDALIGER
jgi:hypothetical protein